jgi:predicted protein tyrosine phosphatase
MPQVNFFFLHKKYQKMLRSKNVKSFCKDIPKSLRYIFAEKEKNLN